MPAKKWFDVLRVTRDAINLEGARKFQSWLRVRIASDLAFDETVRLMLTSTGQSYRDAPVNFYCVTMTPKTITDKQFLQKDLADVREDLGVLQKICVRHGNRLEDGPHGAVEEARAEGEQQLETRMVEEHRKHETILGERLTRQEEHADRWRRARLTIRPRCVSWRSQVGSGRRLPLRKRARR